MKNKLASKLPIQAMIANVINNATEKLASDESRSQKVKELVAYEKKEHGHIPSPAEERAEHEKTASVSDSYIEKLASAVEFIAQNLSTIEFPPQPVIKQATEGSPAGAGKGPGALEILHPVQGKQSYNLGHARNIDASKSQAGASLSGEHPGDGKTQMENDMEHAPGGGGRAPTAKYPPKGPLVAGPTATKHAALRNAVLAKLAGEDVLKANITAERSANPLAGMGQLESFDAEKAAPHQAGDASGGSDGNQARRLIASNQAVIDATKRDAKGPVKSQLSEVLEEPALSSSTDPVLNENLRNTGSAGVKIAAAARDALTKVAQQGCTCQTIDGECAFCRLSEKVAAATQSKKGSVKTANAMMGYGGGGGGMSPPPMAGGGMGGGMTSMADAGAGADGCQCGGTGECRICKLKAALAAAKAQGGMGMPAGNGMPAASPVEKDSAGAGPAGGIY